MERTCEETKMEESARGGPRQVGSLGAQRGQEARQQPKRPQGWPGQKPQEDSRRQAQRSTATARTAQDKVSAAIASIRARFGKSAIGLGYRGIRYARVRANCLTQSLAAKSRAIGRGPLSPGNSK
jgi:hypothetical protein